MTIDALRPEVHSLLHQNTRTHDHNLYTVPSPTSYPYQWFWDSCWHAILWNHFDSERAVAELRSLVAKQHNNGLIGHVTYWQPTEVLDVDWGLPGTSSLIQPPIIAYALWRVYVTTNNTEILEELYPALQAFYKYVLTERNVRQVDLYGLVNPDESGEDNAPRFDTALNLDPQHEVETNTALRYELFQTHRNCNYKASCTSQTFWVEDLAYNTFLYWNLTIMADIASILKKSQDLTYWQRKSARLKAAMRNHMFIEHRFCTLTGLTGTPTNDDSWSQFLPLLAGLYTHQEAHHLVTQHLLDPDRYWLETGVPTVAVTDPAYTPDEPTWGEAWQHPDWRGAIWMVPHWCLYHGLTRYGFHNEAQSIRDKSLTLIEKAGWRENFHPATGVGQGAEGFTWGGLVIDMT